MSNTSERPNPHALSALRVLPHNTRMEDPSAKRPSLPALVAGFAALYLVWGSTYLAIKFAVETMPPLLMAGVRFLVAGAFLTCAMQMLVGGAVMFLLGTARGEWAQLAEQTISSRSILAFAYLVVIGALLGFTTYAWLIRVAPPTAVSTYAYVNPLVAVL